jgi:hypothetical protein
MRYPRYDTHTPLELQRCSLHEQWKKSSRNLALCFTIYRGVIIHETVFNTSYSKNAFDKINI